MAKIICLKIKRRGDFFRLGAQILRRFMGFYSLKASHNHRLNIMGEQSGVFPMSKVQI